MENIKDVVSDNLIRLRKEKQWTQLELAEKINYSNKAISRWEKGEVLPDVETLNSLAELYGIPLADLFVEHDKSRKLIVPKRYKLGNKLAITLLSILPVWLTATVIYVYASLLTDANLSMLFYWSFPVSLVIALIFNCIWGRRAVTFVIISLLVWSVLLGLYLQLISYNIFMIFFIGIPLQLGIILWSNLTPKAKKDER